MGVDFLKKGQAPGKKDLAPRRINFVRSGSSAGRGPSGKIDPNGPQPPPYFLYDPKEVPKFFGWQKQNKVF